jgi:hypothetical protein
MPRTQHVEPFLSMGCVFSAPCFGSFGNDRPCACLSFCPSIQHTHPDAHTHAYRIQVVRKGDDAKAHKALNALGGDGGGEKEIDTAKAQGALSQLASAAAAEKAAKLERERELAKVKIDSKDVKLIMDGECMCIAWRRAGLYLHP